MLGKMIKNTLGLASDVVKVAAAPVDIAVSTTRIVTKPIADIAEDIADTVASAVPDDDKK